MPAKHTIDIKSQLLITSWKGDVTESEFIDVLRKYQKNIRSKSEYIGFNEILDLTEVTNIHLSAGGLRRIGVIAAKTDSTDMVTKVALIVSSDLAYGLAVIYCACRSVLTNSNKTMRIFKKEGEAYKWIRK